MNTSRVPRPVSQATDEHERDRAGAGWLIALALCAALVGWGLLNYALVRDRPREWDFGVLRDAPGQSIYSTQRTPTGGAPPRQIPPLPEAKPRPAESPKSETRNPKQTRSAEGE